MAKPSISVAIARFEDIVGRGLRSLVDDDEALELVAHDVRARRRSGDAGGA